MVETLKMLQSPELKLNLTNKLLDRAPLSQTDRGDTEHYHKQLQVFQI